MSDKENVQSADKVSPSESVSLFLRYDETLIEGANSIKSQYQENCVITGRNYYIITFSSTDERDSTIEKIKSEHASNISEGKMKVDNYVPSTRQKRIEEAKRKLYVCGHDGSLTEEEFSAPFKPFGEIEEVIMLTNASKNDEPYAFVKFKSKEDAEKAREGVKKVGEKDVRIEISRPKLLPRNGYDFRPPLSLLVTNVVENFDRDSLKELIEKSANPKRVNFQRDHAVVQFYKASDMKDARSALSGLEFGGRALVVINGPAGNKGERGGRRGRRNVWRGRGGRRGRGRRRGGYNNNWRRNEDGGRVNGQSTEIEEIREDNDNVGKPNSNDDDAFEKPERREEVDFGDD